MCSLCRPATKTCQADRTPPATGGQGAAHQVIQPAGSSSGRLSILEEHDSTEKPSENVKPDSLESLPDSSAPALIPDVRRPTSTADGDAALAAEGR